jgi:microcystin-dependent protein
MKNVFLTLLLLLISLNFFAQGIAVQGIARDNENSAITDTSLTFKFSITKDDNTVLYEETKSIKTDNFGVFSHIVKNGNPWNNAAFSTIDFSIQNLKMKVSVNYNNTDIEVYNQPFQYTPYAHFAVKAGFATNAGNGVPTGAIMPYAGDIIGNVQAPEGWVLCDGKSLPNNDQYLALRNLIGNNAPDLRGMFLRGAGTNDQDAYKDNVGPALRAHQGDDFKAHLHAWGTLKAETTTAGAHTHSVTFKVENDAKGDDGFGKYGEIEEDGTAKETTDSQGAHTHAVTVSGSTALTGGRETRPVNYGVNYIIKL